MDRAEFGKRFAEDNEFAEKILSLDSLEDAKALMATEGLEHSDEEIAAFLEEMKNLKEGKLSDAALDAAVGGLRQDAETLHSPRVSDSFRAEQGLL